MRNSGGTKRARKEKKRTAAHNSHGTLKLRHFLLACFYLEFVLSQLPPSFALRLALRPGLSKQ
jgi:hypothetical protein